MIPGDWLESVASSIHEMPSMPVYTWHWIPSPLSMYLHQLKRSRPLSNPAWVHSFCTEYIIVYICTCPFALTLWATHGIISWVFWYNFHRENKWVSGDIRRAPWIQMRDKGDWFIPLILAGSSYLVSTFVPRIGKDSFFFLTLQLLFALSARRTIKTH